MNEKNITSSIFIFFLICFVLFLISFAGCISQTNQSNVSSGPDAPNNPRFLKFSNGIYSINASVPRHTSKMMIYSIEKPDISQEWISSLAKNLGMSGKIKEGEKAYYSSDDDEEVFYFVVFKDERKITFRNLHGNLSNNLTEEMALSSVKNVLTSSGLLFQDVSEPEFTTLSGKCSFLNDDGNDCKKIIISYRRNTSGFLTLGSTMMLTVGSQGKIIGLSIIWPDYRPYKEVELKSPEQAFAEFQTKELYFIGPGIPMKPEKVEVTDISLVYSNADGKYLQPVYLFVGYAQDGENKQKIDAIQIPASRDVIE